MTLPRLTPLMTNILLAASRGASGVRVRDLVDATVRYDRRSLGAARVAVGHAARALWRSGYAELHGRFCTMTEHVIEKHEVAARAFRDPERFYQVVVKMQGDDPYGSAGVCASAKARVAQKMPRLHVQRITITGAGLERLAEALGGNPNSSAGGKISDPAPLPS